MFETTVVESRKRKRSKLTPWVFSASLVLHVVGAAAIALYSIVFEAFPTELPKQFETYRLAALPFIPPPPPPPPQGNPIPKTNRRPIPPNENIAPTVIPEEIPQVQQVAQLFEETEFDPNAPTGVEGGDPNGVPDGVTGGVTPAEPPARDPDAPVVIARDDKLPMAAVSQTYPQYPEKARLKGIQGSVVVRYKVGKNGRVLAVEIVRPSNEMLNTAAVNAIKWWRFKPYVVDGEPVEVVHELTIIFQLEGGRALSVAPVQMAGIQAS